MLCFIKKEKQCILGRTDELDQLIEVLIPEEKEGSFLGWGGDVAFVPTGKEKPYLPSKLMKVRFDQLRPTENLSYRQREVGKINKTG